MADRIKSVLCLAPFLLWYFARRIVAKAWSTLPRITAHEEKGPVSKNNEVVRAAAEALGHEVEALPNGFLAVAAAEKRHHSRGSYFEFESLTASLICGDKEVSQQILQASGFPVPVFRCFSFSQFTEALRFKKALGGRFVTKPSRGTSDGAGVTIGIHTTWGLLRGFAQALANSKGRVLVETHCEGTNYRLTVLGGELINIIERKAAHVVGDGTSTIDELIRAKNAHLEGGDSLRWSPIRMNRRSRRYLGTQGHRLGSIPAIGSEILLNEMCFADLGGELRDVSSSAHPSYAELAIAAAECVGARLCGVDLITTDIGRPWQEVDCALNEVNTTPALYITELPGAAEPTRIGERVIEKMILDGAGWIGP